MKILPFGLSDPPPEGFEKRSNKKIGPPSPLQQVTSVVTSVVRHIAGGMPQASDEERARRMDICKGCPLFENRDPENPTCNDCGCYLKIKTSWALEACPQNKWGSVSSGECGCKST